jgi:NDP-sugar pyrophosphorylase family protein
VPYGIFELDGDKILTLKEKPTYTYHSNAGIYLIKKELLNLIPKNSFFNATDLMTELIKLNKTVINFPIRGYWLDIGQHEDYIKAQEDIKHINF